MHGSSCLSALCLAATLSAPLVAQAAINSWTGMGDRTNWFDADNWSEIHVPQTDEDVVISNAYSGVQVLLTNSTAALNSLLITNATLVCTNWNTVITAATVIVSSNGAIRHGQNSATATNEFGQWVPDARVYIVCSNLTVARNGQINADGKGYAGGIFKSYGKGPGAGGYYTGGGYGGSGFSLYGNNQGWTNGSLMAPDGPGSGGGGGEVAGTPTYPGGAGGGMVRIEASGTVLIDGNVTVNGIPGDSGANRGAGSGGGLYLACGALTGSGSITANGGSVGTTGAGGGGRIAILSGNVADWMGTVQAAGGFSSPYYGQVGTLYMTDGRILREAMTNQKFRLSGVSSWTPSYLSVSNCYLGFEEPGFQWIVTNDMTCEASSLLLNNEGPSIGSANLQVGGNLRLNLSSVLRMGRDGDTNRVDLQVGGFLALSNNCKLWLYSGITNAPSMPSGGVMRVGQDVSLSSNSTIYVYSHPTNGGSLHIGLQNLTIGEGCVLSAAAAGFAGCYKTNGWGPGGGLAPPHPGGGGYGGHGGQNLSAGGRPGGPIYGNSNAPAMPGSAGGGNEGTGYGARGGGLIWLDASGDVNLDGTINANGQNGITSGGGGSGGGIYITCQRIIGDGTLTAIGGNDAANAGKGGGGRIAVWRVVHAFLGAASAAKGSGTVGDTDATDGTIVWGDLSIPGMWVLLVLGDPQAHGIASPDGYGGTVIADGTEMTNSVTLTGDETNGLRYICYGWQLADASGPRTNGGSTQTVFIVNTNLSLTWLWTNQYWLATSAGSNGSLVVDRTGWYTNGVTVQVEATNSPGYTFLQWVGPGVPDGGWSSNPLALTMDRPRTLSALFANNTPMTRTWTGVENWTSETNWDPAGIPGSNDTVIVGAGTLTLSDPVAVATLTVSNGATLVFSNWYARLTAANILVFSNGAITHTINSATTTNASGLWVPDARINIVCTNLTVAANGAISATGKGYRGGLIQQTRGFGPGGGAYYNGGSHGGRGGYMAGSAPNSYFPYGLTNAPVDPGSGGSGGETALGVPGGAGGGLIRVEASGVIAVDGTIAANGGLVAGNVNGGCGSGGGINLTCQALTGTGSITANGGTKASHGGGGGGRIGISCADASGWSGTIHADGGVSAVPGQVGTLYISDPRFLRLPVYNQRFRLYGIGNYSFSSLTLNNSYLGFEEPEFTLVVTNDMTCSATSSVLLNYEGTNEGPSLGTANLQVGGNLSLNQSSVVRLGRDGHTNPVNLQIGGNLSLSNNCQLWLYSGITNSSATASGGILRVAADVALWSNSTIYLYSHPTNGGSIFIGLRHLTISTGCSFNAAAAGFAGNYKAKGWGPGGGLVPYHPGGGGYGGHGGRVVGITADGGITYGDSNAPAMPGSAGGGMEGSGYGARGGGLVWISASGDVLLDGSLNANAQDGGSVTGGGAGGGIYLFCAKLRGAGALSANGGCGGANAGKGGGGRIAVWYISKSGFTGTASAAKGSGASGDTDAMDGTIVWVQRQYPGTVFTIR